MSARQGEKAALFILEQVLSGIHYGEAQRKAFAGLEPAACRAATAYSRMALENLSWIDHVLESYIQRKKTRPYLLNILRLGTARCLFGREDSAAVNGSVELAKELGKKGQPGFINGVLRAVLRDRDRIFAFQVGDAESLALRYSWPVYAANQMVELLGLEGALALAASRDTDTYVRVNPMKTGSAALLEELSALGMAAEPSTVPGMLRVQGASRLAEIGAYREGRMSLMGLASRIATGFAPRGSRRIIDVCAAPGGKSCSMGEDHPEASILAMDVSPNRVEEMAGQIRRLGLGNIETRIHDGQERDETLVKRADFVLVDAPCSGLGTFHNRPEVKFQKPRGDVRELHYIQRRILEASAAYVKPGGRLLYCTCTFTRDENEAVVKGFLEANPGFALRQFPNSYLTDAMGQRYREGQLRLWSHLDGTDCFYLATMERL